MQAEKCQELCEWAGFKLSWSGENCSGWWYPNEIPQEGYYKTSSLPPQDMNTVQVDGAEVVIL